MAEGLSAGLADGDLELGSLIQFRRRQQVVPDRQAQLKLARLLVQPEDGIEPLIEALNSAKHSIHILVFRMDRAEIEKALVDAAARGVAVTALIAHTNHGGDKYLRRFEMRLLERGITVARTSDDLVRYHGKLFIVDEKTLWLLAFNFTHMDIRMSRSFAAVVREPGAVKEALKLFEADVKRTPYLSTSDCLVVSPLNARERLTEFIRGATKQLLMYEMKISDPEFIELLNRKISEGVDVRVIGRSGAKAAALPVRVMTMRLHARAILRDGTEAFLGSQSLRRLELEARREVGLIFTDRAAVKKMIEVFEGDWAGAQPAIPTDLISAALDAPAKKVAKAVAKRLQMKPVVEGMLDKLIDPDKSLPFEPEEVAQTVRQAFRAEVHDAVIHALREVMIDAAATGHADAAELDEVAEKHRRRKPSRRERHRLAAQPATL